MQKTGALGLSLSPQGIVRVFDLYINGEVFASGVLVVFVSPFGLNGSVAGVQEKLHLVFLQELLKRNRSIDQALFVWEVFLDPSVALRFLGVGAAK